MDTSVLANQQKLTFICSSGTGCHLVDLRKAMDYMDGGRESKESVLSVHLDEEAHTLFSHVL